MSVSDASDVLSLSVRPGRLALSLGRRKWLTQSATIYCVMLCGTVADNRPHKFDPMPPNHRRQG